MRTVHTRQNQRIHARCARLSQGMGTGLQRRTCCVNVVNKQNPLVPEKVGMPVIRCEGPAHIAPPLQCIQTTLRGRRPRPAQEITLKFLGTAQLTRQSLRQQRRLVEPPTSETHAVERHRHNQVSI
jgi:hypothetical protein